MSSLSPERQTTPLDQEEEELLAEKRESEKVGDENCVSPREPLCLQQVLIDLNHSYKQMFRSSCWLAYRPGEEICRRFIRSGECGKSCSLHHPMNIFGGDGRKDDEDLNSTLLRLLRNVSYMVPNVYPEYRGRLTDFIESIVAVLDKYFEEVLQDYGHSALIYGDAVLNLHKAYTSFWKKIYPKKSKGRKKERKGREVRDEFYEQAKIVQQCLLYLNTRWLDNERSFAEEVKCLIESPESLMFFNSLDKDINCLANDATEDDTSKVRKERIIQIMQSHANSVVNKYIQELGLEKELENSCILQPFGSSANGLGSKSSDLDLCLGYDENMKINPDDVLKDIAALIQESADDMLAVNEIVTDTRVPVLKLIDKTCELEVDVVVNNFLALKNTALLKYYCTLEPRFRPLVISVKQWAKSRGCGDPRNATLTSYAWTLLVTNYLINVEHLLPPSSQATAAASSELEIPAFTAPKQSPPCPVSQLLLRFFAYYGSCVNSDDGFSPFLHVLSIRQSALSTGKRLKKKSTLHDSPASSTKEEPHQESPRSPDSEEDEESSPVVPVDTQTVVSSSPPSWRYCIEDPFEEHDLGRVVYSQTGQIHMMSEIRRVLLSFLECIEKKDSTAAEQFWSALVEKNTAIPTAVAMCMTCGEVGHFSRNCSVPQTCYICRGVGHLAKHCPNMRCHKCMSTGHFARNCPSKQLVCRLCRCSGHKAAECPRSKSTSKRGGKLYVPRDQKGERSEQIQREDPPVDPSPSQQPKKHGPPRNHKSSATAPKHPSGAPPGAPSTAATSSSMPRPSKTQPDKASKASKKKQPSKADRMSSSSSSDPVSSEGSVAVSRAGLEKKKPYHRRKSKKSDSTSTPN